MVNKRVRNAVLGCNLKNDRKISHFGTLEEKWALTLFILLTKNNFMENNDIHLCGYQAYYFPGLDDHCFITIIGKNKNPTNSMIRQKDMTQKGELPRLVGAQYATGDQWKNNFSENEEMEPKRKQRPVVDMTGDGSKL